MKNLKKTLAVVLAFAMILGMSAFSTLAFSDVAEGTIVSEAVTILSNLNILTGFEDGTFKPAETVTRAQMAAIICRMLGYEDQAKSSMGTTVFDDVAADHWASGYINVAQAQQIINGYGNGQFGPEDKVTYEQAVKMIVSALGYDLAAQSKGGYPTGYLALASSKGVTKSANGRVGDAAARSTIAVLAYNALEVGLMDQYSWSTGVSGDEYGETDKTILSQYLNIKKYEGVVTTTPITEVAYEGYDVDAKPVVGLSGVQEWVRKEKIYSLVDPEEALPSKINATLVKDVDKFLGKKVVAYISAEPELTTGEKMVYAIAEKQGANESVKFNAAQLVDGLVGDEYNNKLVYKKPGSNKKYDVNINITRAWNNFNSISAPALNTTDDIIDEFTYGGTIELIDSNITEPGYETAIITNYTEEAVVEEVEVDGADIFFSLYTGNLDDIDMESETEYVVIYKDGELVEATAIAAGDTVTTAETDTDARVLYVSSKNVTGSVDGWTDEEVSIAGEEYKPSAASGYSIADLQNKEGIFYLNIDGAIAHADASAAKGGYAFFLNTGKNSGMGSKYYATIVEADGSVKAYNYAKNVIVAGEDEPLSSEEASAYIAGLMGHSQSGNEAYAYVDTAHELVFEVKIKNDEIKNIVAVDFSELEADDDKKYNASTQALGSKTFDETSVMFALAGAYNDDDKIEEDDIKVGKVTEMLADEESYYVSISGLENGIYKAAIGYDLVTSVSDESDIIVITSKKTVSYNDDAATVIEGLQAGKAVKVIIYNEDQTYRSSNGFNPANLAIGDIILTSTVSADGVAEDFKIVFDKSENEIKYTADQLTALAEKDGYVGFQRAQLADDNFVWFEDDMDGIAEEAGSYKIGDAEEDGYYMVMQKSANTVLVNYEEDEREPEISKKSLSKTLIGNPAKYNADVFVRVVDEQIVDVVVYRDLD